MPAFERRSHVMRWWMAAALALWAFVVPRPVDAQVGSRLGVGVDKGKVYGLDVRETPSIVFVVDFAIYETPGYIEEVGDVATGDASEEPSTDLRGARGSSSSALTSAQTASATTTRARVAKRTGCRAPSVPPSSTSRPLLSDLSSSTTPPQLCRRVDAISPRGSGQAIMTQKESHRCAHRFPERDAM